MVLYNEQNAANIALDIVKLICQNPNFTVDLNPKSANDIADFIETLENRLTELPD